MIIGFTGTRKGMTPQQKSTVEALVLELKPKQAHHGDCVGADADFNSICIKLNTLREHNTLIHIHPGCVIGNPQRANCSGWYQMYSIKPFLDRNHDIVDACDRLIVCPGEFQEQRRSGTWATYRYALKTKKLIYVVYPDGTVLGRDA